MPLKIPNSLPATQVLEQENIFFMTETRALHQDIRPLKIAILNLMPTKITTETQLLRALSNTPLQVEIDLIQTATYMPKTISQDHLSAFYKTFDEIRHRKYDGMIITGAPVENLEFSEVDYWDELVAIMRWTVTNVHSTLHICWGAQAALHFHYHIPKYTLPQKLFGVFPHRVLEPKAPLLRGFDPVFYAPHSRYTEVRRADIERHNNLCILAESDQAGVYIIATKDKRQLFVTGHSEYDADTLALEYFRDKEKGVKIALPENYFPGDDPAKEPALTWRGHSTLLFTNWLNYYVYQTTPYNIEEI